MIGSDAETGQSGIEQSTSVAVLETSLQRRPPHTVTVGAEERSKSLPVRVSTAPLLRLVAEAALKMGVTAAEKSNEHAGELDGIGTRYTDTKLD
jgi:hypothetical protein